MVVLNAATAFVAAGLDRDIKAGIQRAADAIDSGKVKLKGDQSDMVETFNMFDKFMPTKNYVVPPIED